MASAMRSKAGTQDWFYHSPSQPKVSQTQLIPAMSQVPGLSPMITENNVDENQYKRKWIRDTDSKYVKLAKAGGRKDLFRYRDHKRPDEPVTYARVDWFDHDEVHEHENDNMDTSRDITGALPEWFQHEEHKKSEQLSFDNYEKRPLLGFDALTAWKRDAVKLPEIKNKSFSRKSKSVQETKKQTKLPPIQRKKSIDNGDMVGLLSFQYQKDFISESQTKCDERKKRLFEEKRLVKEKLQKDRELFQMKKKKPDPAPQKPMFKLSKFESVSSRTVSHR